MTIPSGYCSYCHKGFIKCDCEQFHPNVTDLNISIIDAVNLLNILYEVGYISHENIDGNKLVRRVEKYAQESGANYNHQTKKWTF